MGAGPKNARGGPTGWVTAVDKVRAGLPEFLAHFLGTNLPRAFWSAHPALDQSQTCFASLLSLSSWVSSVYHRQIVRLSASATNVQQSDRCGTYCTQCSLFSLSVKLYTCTSQKKPPHLSSHEPFMSHLHRRIGRAHITPGPGTHGKPRAHGRVHSQCRAATR